jgi:hypothetical protein
MFLSTIIVALNGGVSLEILPSTPIAYRYPLGMFPSHTFPPHPHSYFEKVDANGDPKNKKGIIECRDASAVVVEEAEGGTQLLQIFTPGS